MISELGDLDRASRRRGIHLGCRRHEHVVDPERCAEREIVVERARVLRQVVGAVELQRVDEDADDGPSAFAPGTSDQPSVAVVQRAHGGDESDTRPPPPRFIEALPERGNRLDDLNTHRPGGGTSATERGDAGNCFSRTSATYVRAASTTVSARCAYCFTNEGTKPSNSPSMS